MGYSSLRGSAMDVDLAQLPWTPWLQEGEKKQRWEMLLEREGECVYRVLVLSL